MSVLVTPDEMRAVEAAAVAAGRSEPELMLRAATEIAAWLTIHIPLSSSRPRFAVALVGPGNNGGDALVTLALLRANGWRVGALMLGRQEFGHLPAESALLEQIELLGTESLVTADVILDGVYGIGGRAALPAEVVDVFQSALEIRIARGTPLIAIDVPSGTDAGSGDAAPDAFNADITLCLGLPKIGLTREPAATHVGELIMLDIGIEGPTDPHRPQLIGERLVRQMLPRRKASAHKHQTGAVLVIGGAPTYYGAPRLTAEAAARAGVGLVCVAVPKAIVPVIAAQVPELVLLPLEESPDIAAKQIQEWVDARGGHVDTFVVGPGMGQGTTATALLERLFSDSFNGLLSSSTNRGKRSTFVLDADALNWIARRGSLPTSFQPGSVVMTPHAGELGRLLNLPIDSIVADTISYATRASAHFKQTVVLKSGYSVAASLDGTIRLAPRAAPELATAGTGDVLAGLIGGLLAQGLDPLDAASVALYVGSMAGRNAKQQFGERGVIARDVIDRIPTAMAALTTPNATLG